MKAVVQERYGPPETLRLVEEEPPVPAAGQVTVRVRAASVNPADWHIVRGDPRIARPAIGLLRPRKRVAGSDAAGVVEAVGAGVETLAAGDEVFGFAEGAFAEVALARAELMVAKPPAVSFEHAAAVPMAGSTALRAIRDVARVQAGQRVLVIGAAGGVGGFAVQIARSLGAEVTGVCSAGNAALVRSYGATRVIDYTGEDFAAGRDTWDVILDNVGARRLADLRRALTPTGTLVFNAGGSPGKIVGVMGRMIGYPLAGRLGSRRITPLVARIDRDELVTLAGMLAAGTVRPEVSRTYPLAEAATALRVIESGHARAKLVLTLG